MFQPLHMLVTVFPDPKDKSTEGGVLLPDNFDGPYIVGTVRKVGLGTPIDGAYYVPRVKEGDKVLIAQRISQGPGGQRKAMPYPTVLDGDVPVILCDHTDILGIIK